MPKHISYQKPICCFIEADKINESQHYPGWDNAEYSGHEEYNDCMFLNHPDFDNQICWGQVVFSFIESSIDFVQSFHTCQGHKNMYDNYNSEYYIPYSE